MYCIIDWISGGGCFGLGGMPLTCCVSTATPAHRKPRGVEPDVWRRARRGRRRIGLPASGPCLGGGPECRGSRTGRRAGSGSGGTLRRHPHRAERQVASAASARSDAENQFRIKRRSAGQPANHGRLTAAWPRSEEHTSELQSLMRISYAVFCLKKKKYKYI